ncbi:unnamed protein product [Pseudo-nitzschia multistriata]|uniref:Uncharacterized protein n=1 Tax=Pseudo-nitzschia multistriata TaxID=183589 RepID=A0A448ZQA4_9STRA|nr:unnamed protein product [Pseudo-nitzschia multistriata]
MEANSSSSLSMGLRFGVASAPPHHVSVVASMLPAVPGDRSDGNCDGDNGEEYEEEEEEEELPVVSIELERLVGYRPSDREEIDSIKSQLIEAMWMRYKNSGSGEGPIPSEEKQFDPEEDEQQQQQQEEPPPDFDDQIKELLDSRVARFGRMCPETEEDGTGEREGKHELSPGVPYLEIPYPSRIATRENHNNGSTDGRDGSDTARLWSVVRNLAYALEEYDYEGQDYPTNEENDDDDDDNNDDDDDDDDNNNESTADTPQRQLQSQSDKPDPSFWYHLSDHLEHTGRMLSWKHAMALELRDCLRREVLHKTHSRWVGEQRKLKLDQLYGVRETLVHRRDLAKADFDRLVSAKEDAVRGDMLLYDHQQKRLQQQQRRKGSGVGNDGGILGGSDLSFPEEFQMLGLLPKDQLYEEEDWGGTLDDDDDFDYYRSDYSDGYSDEDDYSQDDDYAGGDEDEHDNEDDQADAKPSPTRTTPEHPLPGSTTEDAAADETAATSPGVSAAFDGPGAIAAAPFAGSTIPKPFLRKNRERRKKKARALQRRELREARRREALEQRNKHQHNIETRHTTRELVLAQTLLEALEKKVADVEALLESLQDEVWAAEEKAEQEAEEAATNGVSGEESSEGESGLSLLDRILAMILGALPMEPGSKDRERHFRYVREEHRFIVDGWKNYFGRLPPSFDPTEDPGDEDDAEDDDDSADGTGFRQGPFPASRPAGGPRPTGRNSGSTARLSRIAPRGAVSGGLRPSVPPSATPEEQRMALGIVDNDDGEWDESDDDNE